MNLKRTLKYAFLSLLLVLLLISIFIAVTGNLYDNETGVLTGTTLDEVVLIGHDYYHISTPESPFTGKDTIFVRVLEVKENWVKFISHKSLQYYDESIHSDSVKIFLDLSEKSFLHIYKYYK